MKKNKTIMTKQSFPIPEGCKAITVEQVGNQIITTFEPVFKRWRAKIGEKYYYISGILCTEYGYEEEHSVDDIRHKKGNYFQTEEQAQRAADRLKAELDKFWEEELK